MKQFFKNIKIKSLNQCLTNITPNINLFVKSTNVSKGLININILHTTASLILQENADHNVMEDIQNFFDRIVPKEYPYKHNLEGLDDMPAHIKSCLTNTNLTISIINSELKLGTWQDIFLFEHRVNRKERNIFVHVFGE